MKDANGMEFSNEVLLGNLYILVRAQREKVDASWKAIADLKLVMAEQKYGVKIGSIVKRIKDGVEYKVSAINLHVHEGYKKDPTGGYGCSPNGEYFARGISVEGFPRKKDGTFSIKAHYVGYNDQHDGKDDWVVITK